MKRVIEATELPSGAYLITEARWPRGDLFTQGKHAMQIQMRLSWPLSPYVKLSGMA